LNELNKH